jgi:hypothetical protein
MYSRIAKQLRPKYPAEPTSPTFPYILSGNQIVARCPKCGRLIELRVCQSCQNVMCYDCLIEHQIGCLDKDSILNPEKFNAL